MKEDARKLNATWNIIILLSVSALVWRLFRNKIPTKGNLLCVSVENISHIFFAHPTSSLAWQKILTWKNLSSAIHTKIVENFNQFAGLVDSGKVIA